jgi:NADPH-ferrihemoprotein reductase
MAVSMPISWLQSHLPALVKASRQLAYDDVAVLGFLALCGASFLHSGISWDKPNPYEYKLFERPQEKLNGKAAQKATRNIAQKLDEVVNGQTSHHYPLSFDFLIILLTLSSPGLQQQKDVVVFWGSQSGTAEGFASRLARDCQRNFGLQAMAADLSDYDPDTLALIPNSKLAVFIISTYGEGDPSDNTTELWNYLHRNSGVDLSNIRYLAFGLGNKNYKYYNRVIDMVTAGLDRFDAKSLLPVGRADDANGTTEEDFLAWKESVFSALKTEFQLEEKSPKYDPTLAVIEDHSLTPIDLNWGEPVQRLYAKKSAAACSPIRALPVKSCRQLATSSSSSSSDRCILHMEFDLSQYPEVKYKTGDHLAIWPINPDVEVQRLIKVLGVEQGKENPITIRALDSATKVQVPTPITVLTLFQYYLEICGPVSRETVASLAPFAPTASAQDLLLQLGRDREAYADFVRHNHVNLGRLLEYCTRGTEATWEKLPVSFLIESLSVMQPRYYSISSSSIVQPRQAALTAVVSDTCITTEGSIERIHGLATNYMLATKQSLSADPSEFKTHPYGLTYPLDGPNESLRDGKVYAHIRKSQFKLPVTASSSIIMIAAGTGVAPFRGFLHERARLKSMGRDVGPMTLFYGCRRSDEDYLYRDEIASLQEEIFGDDQLKVVTAFSREDPTHKIYVQDRIQEHSEELCNTLMDGNSYLYVCGSATMARDVATRLGENLKAKNGWGDEELRSWAETQKKHARWQEDVWG